MYFAFHYNLNISLISTVINLICFHNGNTDPLTRPSGSFLSAPINKQIYIISSKKSIVRLK